MWAVWMPLPVDTLAVVWAVWMPLPVGTLAVVWAVWMPLPVGVLAVVLSTWHMFFFFFKGNETYRKNHTNIIIK